METSQSESDCKQKFYVSPSLCQAKLRNGALLKIQNFKPAWGNLVWKIVVHNTNLLDFFPSSPSRSDQFFETLSSNHLKALKRGQICIIIIFCLQVRTLKHPSSRVLIWP